MCAIACTLDIVGDKWSLIIVRDLLAGKTRYNEFIASKEEITTSVLADRLKRLEEVETLTKHQYQDNPPRHDYALTEKGRALGQVIGSIAKWGLEYIDRSMILGAYRP